MTQTTWRFLNGPETYQVDLPTDYVLDQSITTVRITSDTFRKIVFHPNPGAEEPAELPYLRHVRDATSPDGLGVSIYEQRSSPPVRLVFWRLKAGVVICGFNPEHHSDIDRYIEGIAIADDDLPSISYGPSFVRGDQRDRAQRDQVWFTLPGTTQRPVLGLARLTRGRRSEAPQQTPPSWVWRTSATPPGLLLWWAGPVEMREKIDARIRDVAESVTRHQ